MANEEENSGIGFWGFINLILTSYFWGGLAMWIFGSGPPASWSTWKHLGAIILGLIIWMIIEWVISLFSVAFRGVSGR